jgi:hypothetical protein
MKKMVIFGDYLTILSLLQTIWLRIIIIIIILNIIIII